jgi:mono/diheme cytochrome c family protein
MKKMKIVFFFLICATSTFNCTGQLETVKPDDHQKVSPFDQKCSNCHEANKSRMFLKDEKAWKKTLLRMSKKQGADITRSDVEKLVSIHVQRQKAERELFLKECTHCHGTGTSLSEIKTKQEWKETIHRMMAKAKREISDDKINLLITYHARYQNSIMRKCSRCHDQKRVVSLERHKETWRKTVTAMCKKQDSDICEDEIDIIVRYHIQEQQKGQELFEQKCSNCHKRRSLRSPPEVEKTPDEWRLTIRRMMGKIKKVVEDEHIDTLISYHVRAHNMITLEELGAELKMLGLASSELFSRKCSTCHSLEKALYTLKDEESWKRTIQNMARKQGSTITESDISEMVGFHVERQTKEQDLFLRDCSHCHSPDVALETGKTHEQWRETARKMMDKAGRKISEEELNILTQYHIRYEKTMESLSMKSCTRCHDRKRILTTRGTAESWERIIIAMSEKEGSSLNPDDVRRLVYYHVGKQKVEQEIFGRECSKCHEPEETLQQKKSRDEWRQTIRRMMAKTDKMITDEEVDLLIDYHITRAR